MKTSIYTLAFLLLIPATCLLSQGTVPNGSFENWANDEPLNWTYRFHYAGFQNVFQSDDPLEGESSAELKALFFSFLGDYPAANLLSDTFDISDRPAVLSGYFKGSAAGTDSFIVDITVFSNMEIIGSGRFETTESSEDWSAFTVPINYMDENAAPEKCAISILAGKEYDFSDEGTAYKVDNLGFSFPAGTGTLEDFKPSVYPNPSSDYISVNFIMKESGPVTIDILSLNGKTLKHRKAFAGPGSNKVSIAVKDLSPGVYLVYMKSHAYSYSQKLMVGMK